MDATLTMTPPPPCFTIWRCAHLQPRNTPLRLMPTTAFQPLTEISSGRARNDAPALLIITSRRPKSRAVRSTIACTCSSTRTSTTIANVRRPSPRTASATGSRCSIFRLQTATSAPARANSMAIDLPMPVPPPVMMAVRPSRENGDFMPGTIPDFLVKGVSAGARSRPDGAVLRDRSVARRSPRTAWRRCSRRTSAACSAAAAPEGANRPTSASAVTYLTLAVYPPRRPRRSPGRRFLHVGLMPHHHVRHRSVGTDGQVVDGKIHGQRAYAVVAQLGRRHGEDRGDAPPRAVVGCIARPRRRPRLDVEARQPLLTGEHARRAERGRLGARRRGRWQPDDVEIVDDERDIRHQDGDFLGLTLDVRRFDTASEV